MNIKFFVVQVDSVYNAILGRIMLVTLHALSSVPHFKIKFPTPHEVGEVKRDLDITRRCYRNTLISSGVGVSKQCEVIKIMKPFTEGATKPLALPAEEPEDVELILGNQVKIIKIELGLGESLQTGLVDLLRIYEDIFACVPSDMPSIHESVAIHHHSVDLARKPVRQK